MKKIIFIFTAIFLVSSGVYALFTFRPQQKTNTQKISIVATLFPQYDFAKEIGGSKVEVFLILPPGAEAHAFEPKSSDISKINSAKIFVYTGEFMEPWAHDIIAGLNKGVIIVDAGSGVDLFYDEEENEDEHEGEHHHHGVDPHIWLDFDNAKIMAENIAKALIEVDSENAEYYQDNLQNYLGKIEALNNSYVKTLANCRNKNIVYGGHYAFGYLMRKYNLEYSAAQGFSPDAEPTAKDMIALVKQVRENNIGYIFYEELTSPKIAQTLAQETDTKLLLLNGAHNLTKDDFDRGATFIFLMEENLKNLSLGLGCE